MRWTLLVTLIVLAGCPNRAPTHFEWQCMKKSDRAAQFIIDCAKAANPRSDEEGEDLVAQCESTASHLALCETQELHYYWGGWKPCRASADESVKRACERAGWEGR